MQPQLSWPYSKERVVEPILSQINQICIVKYYILKSWIFYYHLFLDLPSDLFPRGFRLKFYVYFSSLQFTLHFQPISSLLFDHPNNINYAVSPPSCYLLLDPNIHAQLTLRSEIKHLQTVLRYCITPTYIRIQPQCCSQLCTTMLLELPDCSVHSWLQLYGLQNMSFPCDENKPSFTPIQNKLNTYNCVYSDLIKFSNSRPLTCQYHIPAFAVVYEPLFRFIKHSNIHIPCVILSFTSSCKYTTPSTVQVRRFQYLTLLCRLHNYPYCFRYVKCYA